MIAMALTALFATSSMLAVLAIALTVQRYGASALAVHGRLAAAPAVRAVTWKTVEHRHLRGGINVVVLPVRKADYRPTGLRAAA